MTNTSSRTLTSAGGGAGACAGGCTGAGPCAAATAASMTTAPTQPQRRGPFGSANTDKTFDIMTSEERNRAPRTGDAEPQQHHHDTGEATGVSREPVRFRARDDLVDGRLKRHRRE